MIQVFRKLWWLLDPKARLRAAGVLAVFLVVAIFEVVGVASIMPFIAVLANPDLVETNRYLSTVFDVLGFSSRDSFVLFLGFAFFAALAISLVAQAVGVWASTRFSINRSYEWSTQMMAGYLRQPYDWFLSRNSSSLSTNVLAEVDKAATKVLLSALRMIAQIFVLFALISFLLFVDPIVTLLVAVGFGSLYGFLTAFFRSRINQLGIERYEANHTRYKLVNETAGGLKELKVGGLEDTAVRRFRAAAKVMARRLISIQLISELPPLAMQGVFFGGMLLVLLYLVANAGGFQQAAPVAAIFGFAGYRLLPAFRNIYGLIANIRSGAASLDAVFREFQEFASANSATGAPATSGQSRRSLRKSLILRDVVYAYPGAAQSALSGVTIEVPARTIVGLVGSTGSGKTTTVDIMLGLLRPQQGGLFVDGAELGDIDIPSWQRTMGYVPQAIFLADDTIAANIAFGVAPDDIDMMAVERAAQVANLDHYIREKLAHGYQTHVGERGVRLSGGQRQRIGIARALYHDPDILILDEATSALDNLTEQVVMEAIQNLGRQKTVVVIAHRLSTVRNCDRIYILEEGRVSGQGSYEELLESNSHFRKMASAG